MNAKSLYKSAVALLGYNDEFGLSSGISNNSNALTIVNTVLADLHYAVGKEDFVPLTSEIQQIGITDEPLYDGALYGIAMYVAATQNDSEKQSFFAGVYEAKRGFLRRLAKSYTREDVLPKGSDF